MTTRGDLILESPLGRQIVLRLVSWMAENRILTDLGLNESSSWKPLTAPSEKQWFQPKRLPKWEPPKISRLWSDVPVTEVREVVQSQVAAGDWADTVQQDELTLLGHVAEVTNSFGFGGDDDQLWVLTAIATDELRPVADALVSAPATAHWWSPIDRSNQRHVQWDGSPILRGDQFERELHDNMERVRSDHLAGIARGRPKLPTGARYGAEWWSPPSLIELTGTTPPVGPIPALDLGDFIDTFRPSGDTSCTVSEVELSTNASVLEVLEPQDWQSLVAEHPMDVTGTHDGEWRYWSGTEGPWFLPDWESVADKYDGIHVSIGGYLCSSGLALPVSNGYTMLAGWVPGKTLWLRDVFTSMRVIGSWRQDSSTRNWDDILSGWKPV